MMDEAQGNAVDAKPDSQESQVGEPWGIVVVSPDGVVEVASGPALPALEVPTDVKGRRAADALPAPVAEAVAGALDANEETSWVDPVRALKLVVACSGRGAVVTVSALDGSPAARQVRLLLTQLPALVWATDAEQRVTHLIGKLPRLLEVDPRRMIGVHADRFLGTHRASAVADAQRRVLERGEKELIRVEVRGRCLEIAIEALRDGARITGCVGAAIDVTPRWEADRARAASEARLAEAQRLTHVGSFEWNEDLDQVIWSEEMYRIHGVSPQTFAGTREDVMRVVHPDDRERVGSMACQVFADGTPFCAEYRVVRPDGTVRTIETRAEVVPDPVTGSPRLVGSVWDETELVEARAARDRTLSLLHATLEATADGILVVDRCGRAVAHNARFVELWHIPDALVESGDDAAMLAFVREQLDDPAAFLRGVRDLYAAPRTESRDLLRFADGRVIERSSKPQMLDGEIVGRVWSFHEVTEREQLLGRAELLADASRLLTSLEAESALSAVARVVVGRFASQCAVDLVDRPEPRRLIEVGGCPGPRIEPDPGAFDGRTVLEREDEITQLSVPLVARGEIFGAFTFRAAGRAYDGADVELAAELGRRAGLSLQNARLYDTAREALRAREDLLAIAAHEIRGPITSMHLAVQSLKDASLPAPVRKRLFEVIEREDRRLARFVDELLDVGNLAADRLSLSREEVSLATVVHRVVADAEAEIRESPSSVDVRTDDPAVGSWDRFRVEHVVQNLLSNALKFGSGRPITIRVWSEGERAHLSITDRGIGIPPELQEQIFEPFERGRASTRHYGGLGLGLHITRMIVRALGGDVYAESEPGKGSTFVVDLPRGKP